MFMEFSLPGISHLASSRRADHSPQDRASVKADLAVGRQSEETIGSNVAGAEQADPQFVSTNTHGWFGSDASGQGAQSQLLRIGMLGNQGWRPTIA